MRLPSCDAIASVAVHSPATQPIPGAYDLPALIPRLMGKRVGMVVNQTSMIDQTHLVDTLLARRINIQKIFSPGMGIVAKPMQVNTCSLIWKQRPVYG